MKKDNKIPEKRYFDLRVETMLPATMFYRVLAETPEQAAEFLLTKNIAPNSVRYRLVGRRDLKLTVYEAGSNMIKFIKQLLGG